jgi:hypothetical protein
VSLVAFVASASVVCRADDAKPVPPADAPKKNWTEDVKKSAQQFSVYPSVESETPLKMIAAYKWSNPARPNVIGDRLFLLYLHKGRPVASCKIYPTGRSIVHTFISFTNLPLVARQNDEVVWTPPKSAPKFTKLAEAKPPHATASRRRIQLKALAREFTMETGAGEAKRQSAVPELRMLPQPLYRYGIEDEGRDGVVDGAAFCFVANGGNPQALLLIEATRTGDSMVWRYGFTRRTFAQLKAFHNKREVWTADFLPSRRQKSTNTFCKIDLPVGE